MTTNEEILNEASKNENAFNTSLITRPVANQMLAVLNRNEVISEEDNKFLVDHKESIQKTLVNTWIWRTQAQHESILSDQFHPTLHSKFHQAILEQKVQFGESVRLAKEYALLKLRKEELEIDLEQNEDELKSMEKVNRNTNEHQRRFKERAENPNEHQRQIRLKEIQINKIQISLQEIEYQLTEMKIAMDYRMKEVRSWESIKEVLMKKMLSLGLTEEQIYNKEYGELEGYFFLFLNNLRGLEKSTDGGEVNNLIGLARWIWQKAKAMNVLNQLLERCTPDQIMLINKYRSSFD